MPADATATPGAQPLSTLPVAGLAAAVDLLVPGPHGPLLTALAGDAVAWQVDLHRLAATVDLGALVERLPTPLRGASARRLITFVGGRLCAERSTAGLRQSWTAVGVAASGAPVWPDGLYGSISHTDVTAFAAASGCSSLAGLGIDSERLDVADDIWEALVELCFTRRERQRWLGGPQSRRNALLLFSAKESGYKALAPVLRRFVDFDEFELESVDEASGALMLAPAATSALRDSGLRLQGRFAIDLPGRRVDTCVVLGLAAARQLPADLR